MKTKLVYEKQRISLVIDDPEKKRGHYDVLAAMTLHEGTGCWQMVDIRLAKNRVPSRYAGSLYSDDFHCYMKPKDKNEANFIRSKLREFYEDTKGGLHWCSFNGIVRGQPSVNGYTPVRFGGFDQAGYFSKKEGLEHLISIQDFWSEFDGDPAKAKIENKWLQPSVTEMDFMLYMKNNKLVDVVNKTSSEFVNATIPETGL